MGILTNDETIVVDCVLTDLGRRLLAANDGSFQIVKFALGDDEIDYGLFNPTGSTSDLQDAAILANTLVFEAPTNEDLALKYKLVTYTDPNLTVLPKLELTNASVSLDENNEPFTVEISQLLNTANQNGLQKIPAELVDNSFMLEADSKFLQLLKDSIVQVPFSKTIFGINQYILFRDDVLTTVGGGKLSFQIQPVVITDYLWGLYSVGTVGARTITSQIRITGLQSGQTAEVVVTVNEV